MKPDALIGLGGGVLCAIGAGFLYGWPVGVIVLGAFVYGDALAGRLADHFTKG